MMRWKIFPSEEIPHTEIFPEDLEELFREWAQGCGCAGEAGRGHARRSLADQVTWAVPRVHLLFSHWLVSDSVTPWTAACQAPLCTPISQSLLRSTPTESMMPANRLPLCHLLLFLPSIFASTRVSSHEPTLCVRWPRCWSILPPSEHSGLISFRLD